MKTADLRLDQVIVDPSLQPRVDGLDAGHVKVLQKAPESWPPLLVVQRGGQYLLIDGFHRFTAAQNLGLSAVPVEVVAAPADGDLHALAFFSNVAHGRPLSLADRRAFAERILRLEPHLANREIARRSGLSANTVGAIRGQLEESAQIEQTAERVGQGGYVYRPRREDGELPKPDPVEAVGDFFTSRERRQQRRITRYLERLSVALGDQHKLKGWETNEEAAEACRATLDDEQVAELVQELGVGALNVLQVAAALGYKEDADTGPEA